MCVAPRHGDGVWQHDFDGVEGDLDLDCSGAVDASISGSFNNVNVSLSGASDIRTNGYVSGNYKINGSGAGSISHKGEVKGKVKKHISGVVSVRGL